MRKTALFVVVFSAFLIASAWAVELSAPRPAQPIQIEYQTRFQKSNEIVMNVRQTYTSTPEGFLWKESGDNGKTGEARYTWNAEERWGGIKMPKPLSYHYESTGSENETIDIRFDRQTNKVDYSWKDRKTGKEKHHSFEVPADTMLTGATFFFMTSFPFEDPKAEFEFHALTPENELIKVKLTHEIEETVTTPAGTFVCYKMKFKGKMTGWAAIGNVLAPDMYIWMEKAAPHRWIQFDGKEAGFTQPRTMSRVLRTYAPQ